MLSVVFIALFQLDVGFASFYQQGIEIMLTQETILQIKSEGKTRYTGQGFQHLSDLSQDIKSISETLRRG